MVGNIESAAFFGLDFLPEKKCSCFKIQRHLFVVGWTVSFGEGHIEHHISVNWVNWLAWAGVFVLREELEWTGQVMLDSVI